MGGGNRSGAWRAGSSERELARFSFEELWELLEGATLGVWKWDVDDDRVTWSPALCRAFGVEDDPLIYGDVRARVHEADRDRHDRTVARYLDGDGVYSIDARFRFADGYRWATARGIARRDESGRAVQMLGWLLDLSERSAKLDAHAQESERLMRFMDVCPAAFFMKDASGRHLYANGEAARLAGTTVKDLVGRRNAELFPADTAAALDEVDARVLASGEVLQWTGELTTPDGTTRQVFDTKFAVTDSVTGERQLAGFGVDVSELHRVRRRAEAAQRLESLGLLAGGVAHDFNNLLMVILGNAELCLAEPESTPDAATTIIEVAKRASEICRDLLAYAGHEQVAKQSVTLDAIAHGANELLRMTVVGGPSLSTNVAPDPPTVHADPTQLQRVLVNLALNAKEAGAKHIELIYDSVEGMPEPCGCVLHSSLRPDSPRLARIAVIDDGEGIQEHERERVFEPFHSSKESGTGLGLSAVHGIVRQHDGAVRLCSRPGHTRFEIFLPIAPHDGVPKPLAKRPTRALVGARILVVDDEPLVARVAKRLLKRKGLEVETAESGSSALEQLAEDPTRFDAILLDLSMPGMSGVEVLHRLRAELPNLPVIVSSGFGREALAEGLRPKREAFLPKPYTGDELDRALASVLDR